MIVQMREWYSGRSRREQRLLLLMLAIAVPLLVWLLIVLPLSSAHDRALQEHLEAVDRHGRVIALADAARSAPASALAGEANADLQLIVTEAAAQAGLALQEAAPSGADTVEVSLSGTRATAVSQWLRDFESRGIKVREMRMTPQPDGTVTMSARLARVR